LRCGGGHAHRPPRARLLGGGPVPERGGHRRREPGQGRPAAGHAAADRQRALARPHADARGAAARRAAARGLGRIDRGRRAPSPMNAVLDKPSLLQRVRPVFNGFDAALLLGIALLATAGMVNMYSVGFDHGTRFVDHGRNLLIACGILFVVAQVPPQRLMALAVPLYSVGVALLVATAVMGITKKGATRWLDVGVTVIQPSEMLKIATPLMLAWWFQRREGHAGLPEYLGAF